MLQLLHSKCRRAHKPLETFYGGYIGNGLNISTEKVDEVALVCGWDETCLRCEHPGQKEICQSQS